MTVIAASPYSCSINYLSVIAAVLYVPVWVSEPYPKGEADVFLRSFVRRVGLQETACIRETVMARCAVVIASETYSYLGLWFQQMLFAGVPAG